MINLHLFGIKTHFVQILFMFRLHKEKKINLKGEGRFI